MNILREKQKLLPMGNFMGGLMGGGGGGGQTTSTSYQTNIPEYARPYVDTMLGATQKQLFTTQDVAAKPAQYDSEGNQISAATSGGTEITGFQPYRAFGGTYDERATIDGRANPFYGQQLSYDPSKSVAGFTDLQTGAQQAARNMQMPGQFGDATSAAAQGIQQALGANQYQPYGFGNQYQAPPSYSTGIFGVQDVNAPNLQQYQMGPAQQVSAPELQQYQMGPAERIRTQSFARPGAAEAFMSPYMQNVVDVQQREARRASQIGAQQQAAEAVGRGAFGGSRDALMRAERERNLNTQLGDIQASGLNAAYNQAQQQFNAEQQARLAAQQANQQAGLTTGIQNLAARLGTQQLGAGQNLQAQLANQQAGLTTGQQNLAAQLGVQQLGAGQNLQAQLANQQAAQAAQQLAEQSRQYGYGQNMTAAQLAAQYGLAGQQATEQSRQFGANLGLQGAQAGIQGATQLAGIGQQQLAAQQGIIGLQNQIGAQKQAYDQQVINQAIQDYANAQQYPLMQLGTMSNMLRGLPMQAQTTNQYVAAPNPITQGIGAMGTYGALKSAGVFGASGGLPSEFKVKSMASGGITSYDVGGEVESQLASMDEEDLKRQAQESSSPTVRRMAQRLLREKQMEKSQGVGPVGPMGVDYQAAPVQAARGGILAFYAGGDKEDAKRRLEEDNSGAPPAAEPSAGILAAPAKTEVAPAPAPKTAGLASYLDPYKTDLTAAKEEAGQSDEYFLGKAKQGMPDTQAIRDYQATQMKERANMEDENKRQRYMRVAQMFAKMGSSPGNVVTAALNAVQSQLPDLIADENQFKKAKRDLDKSIFDVENSIRLEEAGHAKEGRRLKEKALDRVKELTHYLIDAEGKVKVSEAEIKSRGEATAAQREANKTYREAGNFNKAMEQMRAAEGDVARVKGQIEREKALPNSQYASDVATVTRYGSVPNLGEDGQKRLEEAKARIAKQDAAYEARILAAEKTAEVFSNRVKSLSGEVPAGGGFDPSKLTGEDKAAYEWAQQNPKDPRAAKIKEKLKGA